MSVYTGLLGGTTDVNPRRFVKMESSRKVVQAAADTDVIIGISQPGARAAPYGTTNSTVAALGGSDHSLEVYGPGELCLLDIGATVTISGTVCFLTSDGNGKGTPATLDGTDSIGAFITETAASGDQKAVYVHIIPASD
jgi:hypothetical protein